MKRHFQSAVNFTSEKVCACVCLWGGQIQTPSHYSAVVFIGADGIAVFFCELQCDNSLFLLVKVFILFVFLTCDSVFHPCPLKHVPQVCTQS